MANNAGFNSPNPFLDLNALVVLIGTQEAAKAMIAA
jgi:hypothetical protein